MDTMTKGYCRRSRAITKRGRRTIVNQAWRLRTLESPLEDETEVVPSLAKMGI